MTLTEIASIQQIEEYEPEKDPIFVEAVKLGKPTWSQIFSWQYYPEIFSLSAGYPVYNSDRSLQSATFEL